MRIVFPFHRYKQEERLQASPASLSIPQRNTEPTPSTAIHTVRVNKICDTSAWSAQWMTNRQLPPEDTEHMYIQHKTRDKVLWPNSSEGTDCSCGSRERTALLSRQLLAAFLSCIPVHFPSLENAELKFQGTRSRAFGYFGYFCSALPRCLLWPKTS